MMNAFKEWQYDVTPKDKKYADALAATEYEEYRFFLFFPEVKFKFLVFICRRRQRQLTLGNSVVVVSEQE